MCAVSWQWQNDIAFHTGVFITFTFVCLFMLLYHGFVVYIALITLFFLIWCPRMFSSPPLISFIASFFFAGLVLFVFFIFSIVNCHERLAKTEHACTTHFVLCWSLEVFVPLFLVVLIIKCRYKASSLSLFTLLSPICACDGAKDGGKKRVLTGRKTVFRFGLPVVPSHACLYSHAMFSCHVKFALHLHACFCCCFFSISLSFSV